jgi:hypothetical protein
MILEQAEGEWANQQGNYENLQEGLKRLSEVLEELPEEGGKRIRRIYREYLWAQALIKEQAKNKEKASAGYRMRMLSLRVWQKWEEIRLYLRHPGLGLNGTNNASERAIGRSKVRYKTRRGYDSEEGMGNRIGLT